MNIAYFGDSTIAGIDGAVPADGTLHYVLDPLTAYLSVSGYTALNFGVAGQTLYSLLALLESDIETLDDDSIVVLEGGINDFDLPNATFASQLESALDTIETAGHTPILQTPIRVTDGRVYGVTEKAQVIRDKAKNRCALIDMHAGITITMPAYSYGAHPDAAGYAVMGNYADKRIKQILDPTFPAKQRRAALVAAIGA